VRIAITLYILIDFHHIRLLHQTPRLDFLIAHDDVVIVNNNLDVNFITGQSMDLDINCVGDHHAINLGNRTNEININNNKVKQTLMAATFISMAVLITSDDGFFEEGNGSLNKLVFEKLTKVFTIFSTNSHKLSHRSMFKLKEDETAQK
jgi:hypothetical protein